MTDIVAGPRQILHLKQWVTISYDFMFVNGIASVVSISRGINFTTVDHVPRWTASVLDKSLDNIDDHSVKRGFEIKLFLMDR